jgi:hypothetical protein
MKIENICVYNMYPAILGIRNSRKAKDKSDSVKHDMNGFVYGVSYNHCQIGNEDEKLIRKLLKSPDERKFLRQIFVAMDITASIKAWAQIDTYKVGTVRNSESTMFCITKGRVEKENFERYINEEHIFWLNDLIIEYNDTSKRDRQIDLINKKIEGGSYGRVMYLNVLNHPDFIKFKIEIDKWELKRKDLFEMIDANLPGGYLIESHWTSNYEVMRNIYHSRCHHKMYWWKEFCGYIEKLPYFDLLIGNNPVGV